MAVAHATPTSKCVEGRNVPLDREAASPPMDPANVVPNKKIAAKGTAREDKWDSSGKINAIASLRIGSAN